MSDLDEGGAAPAALDEPAAFDDALQALVLHEYDRMPYQFGHGFDERDTPSGFFVNVARHVYSDPLVETAYAAWCRPIMLVPGSEGMVNVTPLLFPPSALNHFRLLITVLCVAGRGGESFRAWIDVDDVVQPIDDIPSLCSDMRVKLTRAIHDAVTVAIAAFTEEAPLEYIGMFPFVVGNPNIGNESFASANAFSMRLCGRKTNDLITHSRTFLEARGADYGLTPAVCADIMRSPSAVILLSAFRSLAGDREPLGEWIVPFEAMEMVLAAARS